MQLHEPGQRGKSEQQQLELDLATLPQGDASNCQDFKVYLESLGECCMGSCAPQLMRPVHTLDLAAIITDRCCAMTAGRSGQYVCSSTLRCMVQITAAAAFGIHVLAWLGLEATTGSSRWSAQPSCVL
mgnify:CR=1 FL=1